MHYKTCFLFLHDIITVYTHTHRTLLVCNECARFCFSAYDAAAYFIAMR